MENQGLNSTISDGLTTGALFQETQTQVAGELESMHMQIISAQENEYSCNGEVSVLAQMHLFT